MARTREFDADRALDAAMEVFWSKGYEAASIEDIVEATSVSRSSLYETFGGKREIFEKALEQFQSREDQDLQQVLANVGPGLARIRAVFEHARKLACEEHRGCLVVNATAELAARDRRMLTVGKRSFQRMERFLTECLKEGMKRGEIKEGANVTRLARFLTNSLIGLRLVAKLNADRKLIDDIVSATLGSLR